ncbi:MAG TPA: ATP-binding cassette domain-containing protein, partial [bacterium]|nr:ATP-binding cassette domain-containing protein [bacterium]
MTQPAIRVQALQKHFGAVKAVDGIDLSVAPGECFGLLGRNGAGKSTTIKMLIGLLPPDQGSATVNGFDLATQAQRLRASIGYVPQSLSVDGQLTGRQNLDFFGKLYGLSREQRRERIPQVLDMLDLADAADRGAATYSGGMIRRLEVGQAVLHTPPVVFLDEPTVGLDPVARIALWKHLGQLRKRHGMTLLLTTHYMEEAELLCDRVAIMQAGKIAAQGTLGQLRKFVGKPKA